MNIAVSIINNMENIMKKLILSSVFAGLVLASTAAEVSAADAKKAAYGSFAIKADFSAGYWANLLHKSNTDVTSDGIDKDDITKRHLIALGDSKMTFTTEGGCSAVAFGALVKLDADPSILQGSDHSKLFRDVYVFGRFGNMIEVRFGSQRDAMWSMIGADRVQGGTLGYNGYYGSLLRSADIFGVSRKDRWVLDLVHANDTGYTNALEVRTVRMAGVQAVLNFKPSNMYKGRLGTYGDGKKTTMAGAQNNIFSGSVNYDNTFGDLRFRGSLGLVYGASNPRTAAGAEDTDAATSLTYRADAIVSWKSLDVGLGWLDNLNTGYTGANKKTNAGKAVHGGVGYQFDSVTWKPRVALGVLWGWKNGSTNMDVATNEFKNQDMTLAFSPSLDFNIREGFRWFVEGTVAYLDEKNSTEAAVKDGGYNEYNVIVGTGFAVTQ